MVGITRSKVILWSNHVFGKAPGETSIDISYLDHVSLPAFFKFRSTVFFPRNWASLHCTNLGTSRDLHHRNHLLPWRNFRDLMAKETPHDGECCGRFWKAASCVPYFLSVHVWLLAWQSGLANGQPPWYQPVFSLRQKTCRFMGWPSMSEEESHRFGILDVFFQNKMHPALCVFCFVLFCFLFVICWFVCLLVVCLIAQNIRFGWL